MKIHITWLAAAVIGFFAAGGGAFAAEAAGTLSSKAQTEFDRRELELKDSLLRRQYENMETQRFDLDLKREFLRVEHAEKRNDKRSDSDKRTEMEIITAKIRILEGRLDINRRQALQVAVALAKLPAPPPKPVVQGS